MLEKCDRSDMNGLSWNEEVRKSIGIAVVVVVGALITDGKVNFEQEAGLRLFMQHSFTTFREKWKTG